MKTPVNGQSNTLTTIYIYVHINNSTLQSINNKNVKK